MQNFGGGDPERAPSSPPSAIAAGARKRQSVKQRNNAGYGDEFGAGNGLDAGNDRGQEHHYNNGTYNDTNGSPLGGARGDKLKSSADPGSFRRSGAGGSGGAMQEFGGPLPAGAGSKSVNYKKVGHSASVEAFGVPSRGGQPPKMQTYSNARILISVISTVDAADWALLAASFKSFERDFGFSPYYLGCLATCQTVAFCSSLPLWAGLLPKFGCRDLLSAACAIWSATTLLTPLSSSFKVQCALRMFNGAALSGVLPIAQAILAEEVPEDERGQAFGALQSLHQIAKCFVSYTVIAVGKRWPWCYYAVTAITLLLVGVIHRQVPAQYGRDPKQQDTNMGEFLEKTGKTFRKILSIPSFPLMVIQGIFGSIPWQSMAFLNMYWISLGFSDEHAARVAAFATLGGIVGATLGGTIGDTVAKSHGLSGRAFVAQMSRGMGIPLYMMLLDQKFVDGSTMVPAGILGLLFYLVATWSGSAANSPICSELVASPKIWLARCRSSSEYLRSSNMREKKISTRHDGPRARGKQDLLTLTAQPPAKRLHYSF
eukprot:gene119-112_t